MKNVIRLLQYSIEFVTCLKFYVGRSPVKEIKIFVGKKNIFF